MIATASAVPPTPVPAAPTAEAPTGAAAATAESVRAGAPWVEQDAPQQWWVTREREYARAACAALLSGMAVRRRGDVLHVRAGGRWHALAVVPTGGPRTGRPAPGPSWVHFDLDRQDWFTFGRRGRAQVPTGNGWQAVRWLAATAV